MCNNYFIIMQYLWQYNFHLPEPKCTILQLHNSTFDVNSTAGEVKLKKKRSTFGSKQMREGAEILALFYRGKIQLGILQTHLPVLMTWATMYRSRFISLLLRSCEDTKKDRDEAHSGAMNVNFTGNDCIPCAKAAQHNQHCSIYS